MAIWVSVVRLNVCWGWFRSSRLESKNLNGNGRARQHELDKLALTAAQVDALESALKIFEAKYQELSNLSEKRQEDLIATIASLQQEVHGLKVLLPADARSQKIPAHDCVNDPVLESKSPNDIGFAQPSSSSYASPAMRVISPGKST